MTLEGFFVSADKKIALSHPKKVSAIKKIARRILIVGNTMKGVKLPGSSIKNPGIINATTVPIVIKENVTNI
jgi:hypothetical protein